MSNFFSAIGTGIASSAKAAGKFAGDVLTAITDVATSDYEARQEARRLLGEDLFKACEEDLRKRNLIWWPNATEWVKLKKKD